MPATSGTVSMSNARTGVTSLLLQEQEQADGETDRAADVEHHDLVGGRAGERLGHLRAEPAGQAISPERQSDAEDRQHDADDLLVRHVSLPSPGTPRWSDNDRRDRR